MKFASLSKLKFIAPIYETTNVIINHFCCCCRKKVCTSEVIFGGWIAAARQQDKVFRCTALSVLYVLCVYRLFGLC